MGDGKWVSCLRMLFVSIDPYLVEQGASVMISGTREVATGCDMAPTKPRPPAGIVFRGLLFLKCI